MTIKTVDWLNFPVLSLIEWSQHLSQQIERRLRGKLALATLTHIFFALFVTTGDLFLIIIILEFTRHYFWGSAGRFFSSCEFSAQHFG